MKTPVSGNSKFKQLWVERRKAVEPKTLTVSQEGLISISTLNKSNDLPLVIEPGMEKVDLPLWIRSNVSFVEKTLLEAGGMLFRGFDLSALAGFEQFLSNLPFPMMKYTEGATPRTQLSEKVYTSTEYPAEQSIALHNELTYVITWPMKIYFFCVTAPAEGGETPIADVRRVLNRIDPKIRERFERKGWMLVRNFGDGFSLPWESTFRTTNPKEVENYCRSARIEFEWKDGNRLRTLQVRPAIAIHPKTGEQVWFNHVAFWHISSLEEKVREMFFTEFKLEELPYNTYYGDGSPIEETVVEEIRAAYRDETIVFPWREGDLLLLDNMLTAHGRQPFAGPRKILVAMGEPSDHKSS